MNSSRLDVGFIPVECPGSTGTGAVHTSTLLIEKLADRHDLTVYVSSQRSADPDALPRSDDVTYILEDELRWLPNPIREKQRALKTHRSKLAEHDLVHAYSSAFIPTLASLPNPSLVTLNSYLPVCPKADFRYHDQENCTGPGVLKCTACVAATGLNRRNGGIDELKQAYLSYGRFPFVARSIKHRSNITQFQALSPHLRSDYVNVGFDPTRIEVIPHFYDEQFLKEPLQAKISRNPIRLLYVGAMQSIKGVEVLLDAFAELEDHDRTFELQLAGTGPQLDALQAKAESLEITDRIEWLGHVPYEDLPSIYQLSDIFVYPGVLDEPFGRVILEAMASGVPIVSSDIGSMEEIIGDAGLTFEPENPADLVNAINRVVGSYGDFLGAIPAERSRFTPEAVVDQYDTLYHATANRHI